jgi:hypothetical protein
MRPRTYTCLSRALLRGGAALLVALTSACIDLVPVGPPAEQPAVLHLSVQLTDAVAARRSGPALIRITATLSPGIEIAGLLRPVTSDTLWIFEQPLTPLEHGPRGQRRYSADLFIEPDAALFAPIPIRPPRIQGTESPPVSIRWPIAWRLDPTDPLLIPPGTDLDLRIAIVGAPGDPSPTFQRWSISLFHADGWFSRGGEGLAPPVITVPAPFLGVPGRNIVAIANLHHAAEIALHSGEYVLRADLSQEVRWNASILEE